MRNEGASNASRSTAYERSVSSEIKKGYNPPPVANVVRPKPTPPPPPRDGGK